jgi:hypothetical protein
MNKKHDFISPGYVYIAENKTIIDPETGKPLLKIGFTERGNVGDRIDELSNSTYAVDVCLAL